MSAGICSVAGNPGCRHAGRMVRRWIAVASLILAFTLPACQPPQYNVASSFVAGRLFFDVEFPGIWPLKSDEAEVEADYLEVVTSKEVIWAIQASEDPKCTTATDNPTYRRPANLGFPLAFGSKPRCFVTLTPAKPIPEGTAILVRARGAVTEGSGQFKVNGQQIVAVGDGEIVGDTAPSQNPWWQVQAIEVGNEIG